MAPLERRHLNFIRRKIIPRAAGSVLEIGAGTGVNFQFYNKEKVTSFDIIDQKINHTLLMRAPQNTIFKQASAVLLPYEDNTFDCVVETLLLCSVGDNKGVLKEIKRVLKDDGLFIHLDHGLPSSNKLFKLFKLAAPAWHLLTRSCRLDYNHKQIIENAGFKTIQDAHAPKEFFTGVYQPQTAKFINCFITGISIFYRLINII